MPYQILVKSSNIKFCEQDFKSLRMDVYMRTERRTSKQRFQSSLRNYSDVTKVKEKRSSGTSSKAGFRMTQKSGTFYHPVTRASGLCVPFK
jgi:hypothetical protein